MKEPKIYYTNQYKTCEVKIISHNIDNDEYTIKFPDGGTLKCNASELLFPTDLEVRAYYQTATSHVHVVNPEKECCGECKETINTQPHYKGSTTWYKVAEDFGLNPWEADICKRVIRCRHKGNFVEDLNKTKDLIDIYLKEYGK